MAMSSGGILLSFGGCFLGGRGAPSWAPAANGTNEAAKISSNIFMLFSIRPKGGLRLCGIKQSQAGKVSPKYFCLNIFYALVRLGD